jgi:hypothetical protein
MFGQKAKANLAKKEKKKRSTKAQQLGMAICIRPVGTRSTPPLMGQVLLDPLL